MALYAKTVVKLIEEFEKLPGIGHKSAQRIAFYLLEQPEEKVNLFIFSSKIWDMLRKKEVAMEKFVPYEKLSKKEKRRLDQARRGSWGDVNPVSRKVESKKAYNRKRTQDWKREHPDSVSLSFSFTAYPTLDNFLI